MYTLLGTEGGAGQLRRGAGQWFKGGAEVRGNISVSS